MQRRVKALACIGNGGLGSIQNPKTVYATGKIAHFVQKKKEPRNFVSALLDLKRSPNFYCHENTGASGIYRKIAWEHSVRVATCRLPGPTPEDAHCFDRLDGTSTFFKYAYEDDDCNIVLASDMGWDEDLDGPGRFTYGERGVWVDAWCELRGSEDAGGWTYDVVANPMLKGRGASRSGRGRTGSSAN
jgi:hypothetical protein